ncbi:MAG TPA: hypothetical protein VJ866_06195 [Pyrinomonadaceae bacterium]|nr:hypothetical protein [Pyrinomonadaceae bacterium]
MTASVGLQINRRAPALTREELRRQVLALVLALVLVWYTFVVPANAVARSYAAPDDEGHDGEVRGVGGAVKAEEKVEPQSVEELDWPEYIYP